MKNIKDTEYPRILVISNNAFSDTSNNGKTLASFFKGFPSDKIAQLYFSPELPSDNYYQNYFCITDSDIIRSLLSKKSVGSHITNGNINPEKVEQGKKSSIINKLRRFDFFRIIRELFWKSKKWKSESLDEWIINFSPDIIFFCAGDSGFAYDITEYIQNKFKTKLIVYITDDYILPRKTISPFWWLRRNYVYDKMAKAVKRSDLFITISEEMRATYKELFGVDSILAMNMTESMKDKDKSKLTREEDIILVYAGGLHFKRYMTLNLLAKAIEYYNSKTKVNKAFLKIYSGTEPENYIRTYLDIEGASKFCGSLSQEELKVVLNQCDIPVHVESFDSKSIESTRLSISTKIPEYLSLEKPVLAIGPNEVASMKYLEDCAFCITNPDNINLELKQLLNDDELKNTLAYRASMKFKQNHNPNILLEILTKNILKINV